MLKLKLQYFGHLMERTDSLEKTLMLGKIAGRRRRGWQRMRSLVESSTQWTWFWASSGSWWWIGKPGVLQSLGLQSQTWLNWSDKTVQLESIVWWYSPIKRFHPDWFHSFESQLIISNEGINVCVCSVPSCVFATLWTVALHGPSRGFFQARMLEWVSISSSRDPPNPGIWPRDGTHISCVSCIAGRFFTTELN